MYKYKEYINQHRAYNGLNKIENGEKHKIMRLYYIIKLLIYIRI